MWNFPSGAKIEFGFLERDADVYRYQGQAYSWIGFDEITHLPTEFSWNYLASRLRTTDPEIETYLRCTANPGGVGSHWVKQRYIEPNEPNQSFEGKDGLTRKFIPAKLADNPYLAKDGVYEKMLESLPPTQKKQLENFWNNILNTIFSTIDLSSPFDLPSINTQNLGSRFCSSFLDCNLNVEIHVIMSCKATMRKSGCCLRMYFIEG